MPDDPHAGNGHDLPRPVQPDAAAGHAALLLVESLLHHLIKNKMLTVGEAIEIVEVAVEVEREVGLAANDGLSSLAPPASLAAIADSLRLDLRN